MRRYVPALIWATLIFTSGILFGTPAGIIMGVGLIVGYIDGLMSNA